MERLPLVAGGLSLLVPGAGQLYNGERAKGIAILCITAGIWSGLLMAAVGPAAFHSIFTIAMLGAVYLFIWFPAAADAYQRASGVTTSLLSGDKAWYVIAMLLTVGPMALPLLWHSRRFSRTAKIIWTVLIVLLAILGIVFLLVIGPAVERLLHELSGPLPAFP
jgi:TM2 domain-containing membrane protein YozV